MRKQLLLRHVSFATYYPQGNGQVESINKVIGRLSTKLVNEKKIDWTAYKVAT
jgi:hypothetical protein